MVFHYQDVTSPLQLVFRATEGDGLFQLLTYSLFVVAAALSADFFMDNKSPCSSSNAVQDPS